ncbi:MAG TPA: helix-turn-helix domain-containing protein, partial [Aggregatilineales bacterium]|nr:helix-turn-helix domain-containing protein [Aggregatilineales bacterium]
MDNSDDSILINPTNPPRADALRNHALLLETARQLFVEQGVESVTMSQIAQAAGVGKGTLY